MKNVIDIRAILDNLHYKSLEERYEMAVKFDKGTKEIEKHFFAAYTLYSRLAHEGHAPSQYWLGVAYFRNLLCADNNTFLDIFTKESLLPEFIASTLEAYVVDDNDLYYARVQEIIKNNLVAAKYWLTLAAEQNDINAIFLLGEMYLEGKCSDNTDEYNLQMAKQYFQQAQAEDHPLSICRLAEIAAMDDDLETAILLYKKAAALGCAAAQSNLGVRYRYGEGVEQDLNLFVQYIKQAAKEGHPAAQYYLSMEYINAYILQEDKNAAVAWCLKAAEGGYAAAQNIMGLRYAGGTGVEQDINKAIYWYRKAAAQKWPDAQFNLATMYDKYSTSRLDLFKAINLYKKAADSQHLDAEYDLGNVYSVLFVRANSLNIMQLAVTELMQSINNVKYCFEQAVFWYSKAASHDHEHAAYNLGMLYFTLRGESLIQSTLDINETDINREGFKWFSIAAQKGHLLAQYNLSLMYKYGDGVAQDISKANALLQQATSKGAICYKARNRIVPTFPTGIVKQKNYLEDREFTKNIQTKLLRLF